MSYLLKSDLISASLNLSPIPWIFHDNTFMCLYVTLSATLSLSTLLPKEISLLSKETVCNEALHAPSDTLLSTSLSSIMTKHSVTVFALSMLHVTLTPTSTISFSTCKLKLPVFATSSIRFTPLGNGMRTLSSLFTTASETCFLKFL